MSLVTPPKPNTLAISWFFGEFKKKTLILKPKYQRNPIWSPGQKCFLIDSLISGSPIPQVYVNIKTSGTGAQKTTLYEVIDGQQRLRAIIEFINGDWALLGNIKRAYPVSTEYEPQIGRKYSELPDRLQNAIWDYPLAVQEIRGWDDFAIRAMFRRLNYVNERLNKQELRHSQYFGEFNEVVEDLADNQFWDEIKLFSRRDSARMKDVEYISELFVVVMDGVQEGQSTLDRFYSDYDVQFPGKSKFIARFNQVLTTLKPLEDFIAGSRFHKKGDFYGLFAALVEKLKEPEALIDVKKLRKNLTKLESDLELEPEHMASGARVYYSTVVEGPNKGAKRRQRRDAILKLI